MLWFTNLRLAANYQLGDLQTFVISKHVKCLTQFGFINIYYVARKKKRIQVVHKYTSHYIFLLKLFEFCSNAY